MRSTTTPATCTICGGPAVLQATEVDAKDTGQPGRGVVERLAIVFCSDTSCPGVKGVPVP